MRQTWYLVRYSLSRLCQILNYNCTFVPASTDIYGYFENGTWHGVIKDIIDRKVDTSMPAYELTSQRLEAIDFSGVFHYKNYILLTRRDVASGHEQTIQFFDTFDFKVWLLIGCLLILAGLVTPKTILYNKRFSFLERLVQIFFKANFRFETKRVLISSLALAGLVLTESYTGYLFSKKVASPSRKPFTDMNTFVDCLETKKCAMVLSTPYVGIVKNRLESNGSSIMARLKKVYDDQPFAAYPLKNLMNIILEDKNKYVVSLLAETDFYYAIKYEDQCKYYKVVLDKEYPPGANSFPLSKNSPIHQDLDLVAADFLDYGLLKNILTKYLATENKCIVSQTVAKADTMAFLSVLFYFLGVAEGFSFIYFLGEQIHFNACGRIFSV